jgi:hypothetical protein
MTPAAAAARLVELTHSWSAASPAALGSARRLLALALLQDQIEALFVETVPSSDFLDPEVDAEIQLAVSAASLQLPGASRGRVYIRTLPLHSHHDAASVPRWAAGQVRSETFGPFVDERGARFWVDRYETSAFIQLARDASNRPFLLIPTESQPRGGESMELTAGTVWLHAQEFVSNAPDGWVGLRIAGGMLHFDGPWHMGGPIRLEPQVGVTLELDLDHAQQTGPGSVRANPPPRVTIRVGPGAVESIDAAGAVVELSEGVFDLVRGTAVARYEPLLGAIVVPFDGSPGQITLADNISPLASLEAASVPVSAAWSLPIAETNHEALGECSGTDGLMLSLGGDVLASWRDLVGGAARARGTCIEVSPGLLAVVIPHAENRRNKHHFLLWDEPNASANRRSSVEAAFDTTHAVTFLSSQENVHAVLATAGIAAHLDRPLRADGSRTSFRSRKARLWILEENDQARLEIRASIPLAAPTAAGRPPPLAPLAISNALLVTTPAETLWLFGRLGGNSNVDAGTLTLAFPLHHILPILPDPYAANIEPEPMATSRRPPRALLSRVQWESSGTPLLKLQSVPLQGSDARSLLPKPLVATPSRHDESAINQLRDLFDTAAGANGRESLILLDVSSNADQFGVGIGVSAARASTAMPVLIRDLDLITSGNNIRVMMLPQVQWEPVYTPPNPAAAFPEKIYSRDDGGPTLVGANTVRLVPVAPIPAARDIAEAIRSLSTSGAALFTLPFGIRAVSTLFPISVENVVFSPAALRLEQPQLGALQGGRQFTLELTTPASPPDTSIPGAAVQTRNAVDRAGNGPLSVLHNSATNSTADTFNETFGPNGLHPGVPVRRVDFSGYGASCFSRWADKDSPGPKISEVRFDVLVGRTAYEVVQERSVLWPWQAIVVRTITIERRSNAQVVRFDSGWVAATPGVFRLAGFPDVFHPGVVKGLYDIREIREVGAVVLPTDAPGTVFQPVRFDADAAIENVVAGQRAAAMDENGEPVQLVPMRAVVGYVQRRPLQTMLTPAQLTALFAAQGAIGGAIDCDINVGQSNLRMRVTSILADIAGVDVFAVAARGTPVLPANAQWGITRTNNEANGAEENEAQPVDRDSAVPLIRKGTATVANRNNGEPYRFADPQDLLRGSPAFDYGFLFANEAFRVLFPRPRIAVDATRIGEKRITSELQPLLADPYAVITTSGPFPKARDCIRFPVSSPLPLAILPGGHLSVPPSRFKMAALRVREQVNASDWRMALEYSNPDHDDFTEIALTLDSSATPPATLSMAPLNIVTDMGPFSGIMRLRGGLEAKSPIAFVGPALQLGSVLAPVQAFITILQDMRLPIAMTAGVLATDDHSYLWKQNFHLDLVKALRHLFPKLRPNDPKKDDERIDLGFGKFRGEINCGMFISFSGRQHAGAFFEVVGELQQPILHGIFYGGGYLKLEIAFEIDEEEENGRKVTKQGAKLELAAAIAGSVGKELIHNVLKAEANVRYGYALEIDLGTGKILPGVIVGMEVEGEFLDGLVGVAFEWEGKGLLTRHEDMIHLDAEVTAAATVTVAWYIEETIEIEGTFETRIDERIVAGLLIAMGLGII